MNTILRFCVGKDEDTQRVEHELRKKIFKRYINCVRSGVFVPKNVSYTTCYFYLSNLFIYLSWCAWKISKTVVSVANSEGYIWCDQNNKLKNSEGAV